VKYYSNLKQPFSPLINYIRVKLIPVTQSCFFSISVTWSFRKHSNMLIGCSRNISFQQVWEQLFCLRYLWKQYV